MAQNNETYIIQRKAEILKIEAKIRALLNWDEMQYNSFVYENGLLFIKRYYEYPELVGCIERSRAFWNWWKVTWRNGDENMLTFILPSGYTRRQVFDLYCHIHNLDALLKEAYPPATVWADVKRMQQQSSGHLVNSH